MFSVRDYLHVFHLCVIVCLSSAGPIISTLLVYLSQIFELLFLYTPCVFLLVWFSDYFFGYWISASALMALFARLDWLPGFDLCLLLGELVCSILNKSNWTIHPVCWSAFGPKSPAPSVSPHPLLNKQITAALCQWILRQLQWVFVWFQQRMSTFKLD